MNTLTFGTSNPHKLSEASSILGIDLKGYTSEDLNIIKAICGGDIKEIQSMDVLEIVKEKAREVYNVLGRPIIVEDTGLYIDALKGFPGPFIKHVIEGPGLDAIFKMMEGFKNRSAKAVTGVCMFDGVKYTIGYGVLEGIITEEPRGDKFGYSNAFEVNGTGKTFGEMTEYEKNQISMRKIAFLDFMDKLSNH